MSYCDRVVDPARSRIMRAIRGKDTKPELEVRRMVAAMGRRFRANVRSLPGSPDLAHKSARWAIFVHGCFWHDHGCTPRPATNKEYWDEKFARNAWRDYWSELELRALGFRTLVVWECELRRPKRVVRRLEIFFRPLIGWRQDQKPLSSPPVPQRLRSLLGPECADSREVDS